MGLYDKVKAAVEEYDAQLAERGPRGGKPTVAREAGEGRWLASQLREFLREEAAGEAEWDPFADQGFGFCPDCGYAFSSADSKSCRELTGGR